MTSKITTADKARQCSSLDELRGFYVQVKCDGRLTSDVLAAIFEHKATLEGT